MNRLRICLAGLGNVGRGFVRLVADRRAEIAGSHGLDLQIAAVVGSRTSILSAAALDPDQILTGGLGEDPASPGGWRGIALADADVLVDATPTDYETGEPGLSNIRTAIGRGMHVIALSKGALVRDFAGLRKLAGRHGVEIKFAGATAAALPMADVAQYCLAGAGITRITGILTGTTNYVLTRMGEGIGYEQSLAEARELGVAEPDPRLDVGGWDTAAKILIVANAVFGTEMSLADVKVKGIEEMTSDQCVAAVARGAVCRLVGEAVLTDGRVRITVGPRELPADDVLASARGMLKAVRFDTELMGELTVVGGGSDVRATAAAAVKDLINLAGCRQG